jgi:magnesium transporter
MVRCFQLDDGKIKDCETGAGNILVYINPDEQEKNHLSADFFIDEHTLNSSLDPDELSRLEFEPEHIALIIKRPKKYSAEDTFLFRVISLGLFLFNDKLILIASEEFPIFDDRRFSKVGSLREALLKLIFRSVYHFNEHLRVINKVSEEIEGQINTSMENKYLNYLFILEKSLVYYLNAINANANLLQKLKNYDARIGFTQEEKELLDDLMIENAQCYRQAEIYSNILSGLMDARASIVGNNLNIMMKRLAVLTVVVGVIGIPANMGGMSEYSRFVIDGYHVRWWEAQLLFLIALIVIGFVTYKTFDAFRVFNPDESGKKRRWYSRVLSRFRRTV